MPDYRDPGTLRFDATIERADVSGSSAFVQVPFSVPDQFGVKGRVTVAATFDGADYFSGAKKPETRQARVEMLGMLAEGLRLK